MIKYGFLIEEGKIYDTQIQFYELKSKFSENNVIYYLKPVHKRLYMFEVLLFQYNVEKVFEILRFNKYLKKNRKNESLIKNEKLHYISNMAVIYNYPPSYLNQKKFAIYKKCQRLKRRFH